MPDTVTLYGAARRRARHRQRRHAVVLMLLILVVFGSVGALLGMMAVGTRPDPAACKTAMVADLRAALADPSAAPAREPAACHGLDAATMQRLLDETYREVLP